MELDAWSAPTIAYADILLPGWFLLHCWFGFPDWLLPDTDHPVPFIIHLCLSLHNIFLQLFEACYPKLDPKNKVPLTELKPSCHFNIPFGSWQTRSFFFSALNRALRLIYSCCTCLDFHSLIHLHLCSFP